MNILQIIPTLTTGGAEQFVINLSNELSENNNVTLLVLFDAGKASIKNRVSSSVRLIELNCDLERKCQTLIKLWYFLSKNSYDIIHTHLNSAFYLFPFAFFNSKRNRFVHTVHNLAEFDAPRALNKLINGFYFKKCCAYPIAITEKINASICKYYGMNNIYTVYNGTAIVSVTEQYPKVVSKIEQLKNKYKFVFCHIARVDPQKNHKLLLDVLSKTKDCYVISMGAITKNNEAYAKNILDYSLGVDNFEYIGIVNNVSDYIKSSDGILFSSNYEGLPISLLESMSLGKICISTPAGGISDIIDNNIGILSDDFSEDSLRSAISQFQMLDAVNKEKMQAAVVDKFINNFSIFKCAKEYINIYREIKL